ncbi:MULTISPECIES: sulfotransferase family 2 domain-containing protein [Marinovum]|uniref:sulfotransferase family 2 domain-containing protein n=1 Tax=Marinovum TaxID=367771 RepID=UPI00065B133E|nr:sulfotransferase family 2 domain-containing protein [Marinovum sp. PR37]AKO95666.1 Sulfotransferase family [Marinovum algicola DG 898]MDD9743478.1 sulfotransferase family 2 domain-containing protein [Marinovum sp. PR37]
MAGHGRVFYEMPRNARDRLTAAQTVFASYKKQFHTVAELQNFLMATYVPWDRSWVYKTNAKAGSSSVLSFLFALEFGVPFSVKLLTTADHNPDTALHQMRAAHVFEPVLNLPGIENFPDFLANTFSFTVVREPARRVLSSFRYICQSNEKQSEKLLRDRIRLSAVTGFDWDRHPGTVDGFQRFLEFILVESRQEKLVPVNNHWRPQWRNVQVDLLKPDLIGRLEDMPAFYRDLCEALNRPLPKELVADIRNRQPSGDSSAFLADETCRRLVRDIYARDYELFGYDPEDVAKA